MGNDILEQIQAGMSSFSKGQKLIANYISKSYDKAAFMTAGKLGRTVGVSESTVVRFASELGYDGYPAMQKALQEMIRSKLTSIQRIEVTNDRLGGQDILKTVMESDMEKIRLTLQETSRADFNSAVDEIIKAKKIYILGVRSSASLAQFLAFYFHLIFDNVILVSGNTFSEIFEQLLRVGPGDVVIGVSYPRYSSRTVKAMEFAKDRKATVIAMTDSKVSPPAESAKYTLVAKSDMASFVDSLVAPLSLINALIVAVGMKKGEDIAATFNKLEQIWDEYHVYEKVSQ